MPSQSNPPSAWQTQNAVTAWLAARDALLENDPALERDEAMLREILGDAEGTAENILARVLRAGVHAEAMAKAADEQAALMVQRKRRYQAREDAMRNLAVVLMETLGQRKVELGDLTASVVKGRPGVHVSDADLVPDIYVEIVTTRKPDKATIKSALTAGQDVPGAELRNSPDHLVIRRG